MRLDVRRTRELLRDWYAARRTSAVALEEQIDSDIEPDQDSSYQLAYVATFAPVSLEYARLEIWLTPDGQVGILFERIERITRRLGVRALMNPQAIAAGHEPLPVPEAALLLILNVVADGEVAVAPTWIPKLCLFSTRAIILDRVLNKLTAIGYHETRWLNGVSERRFARPGVLRFLPWWRRPLSADSGEAW